MIVSTFSERLKEAMNIRGIKAAEIVKFSELLYKEERINKPLNKVLISNYLKGAYEAKQDNIYALSLILNVDEAWLMGADVPMKNSSISDVRFANHQQLLKDLENFNEDDIEEIKNFIEFIKNKKKK